MNRRSPFAAAAVLATAALLAGCAAAEPMPTGSAPSSGEPSMPSPRTGPVQPAGDPVVVASGLTSPWSVVLLPSAPGEALVSERDTGVVLHLSADGGALTPIGTVPGVAHQGEGGLLGLALLDDDGTRWLYAYLTSASDNRIVRMTLGDDLALGAPSNVLTGLAKASNHNGGRLAFGPDGMLYATVGDAAVPDRAQDPASLNGKILRMTPEGGVPSDNPFSDSLVYSLGHRNPQGLAWDDAGQLWAAEFGQNAWDEVNRILPGGNYGWPVVEGQGGVDGYLDPVVQWSTSEASPSALTYVDGTFFVAALRGSRVWALYPTADGRLDPVAWFVGEFGRIRDVLPAADGSLWFVTNNTDGRGEPTPDDDRILSVRLAELVEG
jgi:glucose/arabinose dehydrogenase